MFDMPFFQDNIMNNIMAFSKYYFTMRLWWIWILIVFVFVGFSFFLLRKSLKNPDYYRSFATYSAFFFENKLSDKLSLGALFVVFILTGLRMFSLENSLFENFDLMAINTTKIMALGLQPSFDYTRISPLSFWYLNILYAITQNIFLVKTFVLCDLGLMIYLLYKLFDFIPVAKRLSFLTLFLITPAMFGTSNIIFIERSLFIYLALSLICAKKYCHTGKLKWVAGFLLFANIAIYTKETSILFYFGMLAFSIFYNVWTGKIVLKSFIHPFKMIKSMPLEFLMGFSFFFFVSIYFILISLRDNYKIANSFPFLYLLNYYKFDLIVFLIAGGVLLKNIGGSFQSNKNPLFSIESYLVGGLCIFVSVLFILKIAPISPHLNGKTYYMVVPLLFALGYLFYKVKSICFLSGFAVLLLVYSSFINILSYRNEVGRYYREVAEFFAANLNKEKTETIYISEKPFSEKAYQNVWLIEVWSSSFKYYFKKYDIKFKFYSNFIRKIGDNSTDFKYLDGVLFFDIFSQLYPDAGDWLVVSTHLPFFEKSRLARYTKGKPAFENKLFRIYKVQ